MFFVSIVLAQEVNKKFWSDTQYPDYITKITDFGERAEWVRDHVQWEGLSVFSTLSQRKISWSEIDPEIDWLKFQTGITNATIQWMNIHTDQNWFPHNLPESYEAYQRGDFDYAFADTHNSVTGNYGGMMILPGPIAENIYFILDHENQTK